MCRGPLLVRVVARTLRGSEGKSGRCSCERSPATAPRGPLTWESQRTYRISSAAFCAGWPPAGRARAGLARLDGESPGRREGGGSVFVLGAEFPVPGFERVAVGPGGVVPAVLPAVGLHPVELDGT